MAYGRSGSRFSIYGEFRLLDRFTRPLQRVERRVGGFASRMDRLVGRVIGFGRELGPVFAAAGAAIAGAAAAAIAALQDIIHTGQEFDTTMAMAGARFGARRGSEAFAQLEEAAMNAGATTQYTAQQAAEALAELGASGTNAADAVASLPILLNTAAAAGMELGQTSDILTDEMAAFGLQTADSAANAVNLARVSDVMARGANTTSQSFEQLTGALGNVAAGAHSAGYDIEHTTALIGALADQGEKGDRAGTRLNAMLTNLRNPTAAARAELRRLHVETRDARTHALLPMTDVLAQFEQRMAGMNAEARDRSLGRIFSEQGLRPMLLLLQTGSSRLRELDSDLRNSGGASEEMARQMRDSAGGDMQSFNSTIESVKLELWALIRGPYRAVVQATTEWIRANAGWVTSGLQEGIEWLTAHMPEIEYWAIRIGIAFLVLLSPIILAMAAMVIVSALIIGLIVGIVAAVVVAVEWLWEIGSAIWESVSGAAAAVWEAVSSFVTAAQEFFVGLWVIVSRAAMQFLRPVFDFLGRAAAVVQRYWAPIGAFFSGVWNGVAKAFGSVWGWIMGEAGGLYTDFLAIWDPLAGFFTNLWNAVAGAFWNILGGVIDAVGNLIGDVRAVGRDEMQGDQPPAPAERQMVSPQERAAREGALQRSEHTDRAEVVIRDQTGRAQVTRPPRRGGNLRIQSSGAL